MNKSFRAEYMSPMVKKLFLLTSALFSVLFLIICALVLLGTLKVSWAPSNNHKSSLHVNTKRRCVLMYFRPSGLEKEEAPLVWIEDEPDQNIKAVLNAWFEGALRDSVVSQKIIVESVAYDDASGEVILSLSGSFCDRDASTREKLRLVESVLATLHFTGIPARRVLFLVRQQPFSDRDLDFSCFWPIEGFIEKP